MAAGLELGDVRIAVRIVDELVMGQMLQAIVLGRGIEREHAEPIRDEIVPQPVFEERMVGRLMGEGGKLVLARADEHDRDHRHRHVPPRAPAFGRLNMVKPERQADDRGKIAIDADKVVNVREVIRLAKLLELFLDVRVL